MMAGRLRRTCMWMMVVSLLAAPPVIAGGGGFGTIVFDPSNFGKNSITAAQTIEQTLKQAQMVANQLQQINMQIRNLANIPNGIWSNVMSQLGALTSVVQQGQALAYTLSNLDTVFRLRYPGYIPPTNYPQQYKQWSEGTLDGIRGALRAANLQSNQFATESAVLDQLKTMSNNATGRMQALQVGNMIAMQQVQQTQKLRQLFMAQMQAENGYLATKQQDEAASKAAADAFFRPYTPRGGNIGFKGGSL